MRQVLINSDQDNQRFEERFSEIAQAIADGIMDTIGKGQPPVYRGLPRTDWPLQEFFPMHCMH